MRYFDLKRTGLVWIGILFGLIFWILESALHILVFNQIRFMQQIFSPEPHELWMRLTIVGMFITFGIYVQIIVNSRWKAEKAVKLANTKLIESREKLRSLAAHLQVIREEERERIANELHDELGQALTALKMDIHWILSKLPGTEACLVEKAGTMSTLIDTTVQSVKRIISELHPRLIDDFGLSSAMEWQVSEFMKRTGIQCDIELLPDNIILDKQRSIAIFRIFQETLTNITRHSEASKVTVSLKENETIIEMRVFDNGKGIAEKQLSAPQSFGIIGMRERAYAIGGNLSILTDRGAGTTVTLTIPRHWEEEN